MKKVGIIHTTSATIASLNALARDIIGEVEIINILDDSILKDMREVHEVEFVRERWIGYAKTLQQLGVDAVLSACSTVGGFAEEADEILSVPVYRIDEAMCERAVEAGSRISVFATLQSTLDPTVDLVRRKADAAGCNVNISVNLVEGAYASLMEGNKEEHDRRIRDAVMSVLDGTDVVQLAQASMASALEGDAEMSSKILTSPKLGIERLKENLGG